MTLEQAFENIEFNVALDKLDFPKAFSYLDKSGEREKLFLFLQEEGYNPLQGFTEIPFKFLNGCKNTKHIIIPDSVTSIDNWAFQICNNLMSVTFGENSQLTTIGSSVFYSCDSLTEIVIPDSVTSIGNHAFGYCDSLTKIILPESLTSISRNAFTNCRSLTEIIIPNSVTSIDEEAFSNCKSLMRIEIPDSVTSIGSYAFWACSNLTTMEIGDNVTNISNRAFHNCYKLTKINYRGTISHFKKTKLYINQNWLKDSSIKKILCSDGIIDIQEII